VAGLAACARPELVFDREVLASITTRAPAFGGDDRLAVSCRARGLGRLVIIVAASPHRGGPVHDLDRRPWRAPGVAWIEVVADHRQSAARGSARTRRHDAEADDPRCPLPPWRDPLVVTGGTLTARWRRRKAFFAIAASPIVRRVAVTWHAQAANAACSIGRGWGEGYTIESDPPHPHPLPAGERESPCRNSRSLQTTVCAAQGRI